MISEAGDIQWLPPQLQSTTTAPPLTPVNQEHVKSLKTSDQEIQWQPPKSSCHDEESCDQGENFVDDDEMSGTHDPATPQYIYVDVPPTPSASQDRDVPSNNADKYSLNRMESHKTVKTSNTTTKSLPLHGPLQFCKSPSFDIIVLERNVTAATVGVEHDEDYESSRRAYNIDTTIPRPFYASYFVTSARRVLSSRWNVMSTADSAVNNSNSSSSPPPATSHFDEEEGKQNRDEPSPEPKLMLSRMAKKSLVCAIIGFLLSPILMGILLGPCSVCIALSAKKDIHQQNENRQAGNPILEGKEMAQTAIIVGIMDTVISLAVLIMLTTTKILS